jgi:hypothetical protein
MTPLLIAFIVIVIVSPLLRAPRRRPKIVVQQRSPDDPMFRARFLRVGGQATEQNAEPNVES